MSNTAPVFLRRLSGMPVRRRADASSDLPLSVGKHQIFSIADLSTVPAVVARYFHWALSDHRRLIRQAWIRTAGGFLIKPRGGWSAFSARQHYTATPPGFVWNATIYMMRVSPIRARDSYGKGEGHTRGRPFDFRYEFAR